MVQPLMIIFELSSKWCYTNYSRKVVEMDEDLIRVNFSYIKQPNMVTLHTL
jgi:hypothetical protein